MKKKLVWIVAVLFSACNALIDVKDLGDGYYFETDQIVHTEEKRYDGIGLCVIPPKVLSMGFDNDFILISSRNNLGVTVYWIILKNAEKKRLKYVSNNELSNYHTFSNVFGPLNDSEFTETRKNYHVPNDL